MPALYSHELIMHELKCIAFFHGNYQYLYPTVNWPMSYKFNEMEAQDTYSKFTGHQTPTAILTTKVDLVGYSLGTKLSTLIVLDKPTFQTMLSL